MNKLKNTRVHLAATTKTALKPAVALGLKVHDPVMSGARKVKDTYVSEAEKTRAILESKDRQRRAIEATKAMLEDPEVQGSIKERAQAAAQDLLKDLGKKKPTTA